MRIVAVASLIGLTSGCVEEASSPGLKPPGTTPPTSTEPSTARGYLAKPRTFRVAAPSTAVVTAKRSYGASDDVEETATLPLVGGDVTVQAQPDGHLVLASMNLELGNIELSAKSVPPDGINLMDVKLSLRQQTDASADWASDMETANASAMTDLLLDWSLEGTAGTIVPLATQRITDVPLEITVVESSDGHLSLDVRATRDGVFWSWTGLIELSDLRLDLVAAN